MSYLSYDEHLLQGWHEHRAWSVPAIKISLQMGEHMVFLSLCCDVKEYGGLQPSWNPGRGQDWWEEADQTMFLPT